MARPVIVKPRELSKDELARVRRTEDGAEFLLQDPGAEKKRFIPVRTRDIIERLVESEALASDADRQAFRDVCALVAALVRHDFELLGDTLSDSYAPFAPAADTEAVAVARPEVAEDQLAQFLRTLETVLDKANFESLSLEELNVILKSDSTWGIALRVDLRDYHELRVFWRGESSEVRKCWRPFKRFWGFTRYEIPTFRRVFLVMRQAKTTAVLVKLFRDVPKEDLEMLFPTTRPAMSRWDKLQFMTAVLAAVGSAVKLALTAVTTVVMFAVAIPVWAIVAPLALLVGGKAWLKYKKIRDRYLMALTSSLYHRQLDANMGALKYVVDLAEQEEIKEAIIAYFFLLTEADRQHTTETLDRRIETWLFEEFGVAVDFEIADAVNKLADRGLVETRAIQGRPVLTILDLEATCTRLDAIWDNLYQFHHRQPATAARTAPPATLDGTDASRLLGATEEAGATETTETRGGDASE